MRELDRLAADPTTQPPPAPVPEAGAFAPGGIALVGAGRVGRALAQALRDRGVDVRGPYGRGGVAALDENGSRPLDAILLCVPDAQIPTAAQAVARRARLVGHTSGATPLSALAAAGDAERFGLHPLQTFSGVEDDGRLAGAGCAIAGSTPSATAFARDLAGVLGLVPFEIADGDRAAYHAAAAIASNFLVTLQDIAEGLAGAAGLSAAEARRALVPLVRETVGSWAALGPERALTGPVARGDEHTVDAQRDAVHRHDLELLPLFDALVTRTRALAERAKAQPPAAVEAGAGR